MTNLDKVKAKVMYMSAEEIAKYIDEVYFSDDYGCEYCAYDNDTCSGDDCVFGITAFLERKVD